MIASYSFSLTGRDHVNSGLPCHDYSTVSDISSSWKIAVVADGVGSCKHAEIASKIAVETVVDLLKKQFPPYNVDKGVYKSIICSSMHGAANAIESFVEEHDAGNELDYQTTLALAIMSKNCLIYGNAGDSGIIALDEQGKYHVMNRKQKSKDGGVFSMPMYRDFEVGVADFIPAAVMCSTDGVFDYLAPKELADKGNKIYVPLANLFVAYGLGGDEESIINESEKCKARMINYLSSDACNMMTDDLSVAVLVLTDSFLQPEDIEWEEPEIDSYSILWNEVQIYPSEQTRINCFLEAIREKNPEWSDEQIEELAFKYVGDALKNRNNGDKQAIQKEDEISKCDVEIKSKVDMSDSEDGNIKTNSIKNNKGFRGLFSRKRD